MRRLPADVQTLYAELLEQLTALEAARSIGHVAGTFVTKTIKGRRYYYFQHMAPGGRQAQVYLGPASPPLEALAARHAEERVRVSADRENVARLCAELRAGGAATTDAASARVLAALADAAVFRLGGVLVGTHAFAALGNMLGVRWEHGALRTDDVDVAADPAVAVAVPELSADVPAALDSLAMGFLPVPGLSPHDPATSFKVRGRPLRVDLLTPAAGRARRAVALPRFRAAAEPLPYLDYVLEDAQAAAIVDGGGVLVRVPQPARFALHKLLVAADRPAAFQAKADKDLRQAAQLIEVLAADRPGDLGRAARALARRGPGWRRRLRRGAAALARRAPEAADRLARFTASRPS